MATRSYDEYNVHEVPGMIAGEDLSSSQYMYVNYDGDDGEVVASGSAVLGCGILMNAPEEGEVAKVAGPGSYVLAEILTDTPVAGAYLYVSTSGKLRVITGDTSVAVAQAHTDGTAAKRSLVRVMDPQYLSDSSTITG